MTGMGYRRDVILLDKALGILEQADLPRLVLAPLRWALDWVEGRIGKIGEILDVVSARLPVIMGTIRDIFLSESAGRDFGKAVGAFYKELVAREP